mmetsp:Transcript_136625/g.323666  ORF Transcript_136625/g.323666 Transcript_136625/m.323666 type:complete len:226 (-) Transcript_136625:713-1390(-)
MRLLWRSSVSSACKSSNISFCCEIKVITSSWTTPLPVHFCAPPASVSRPSKVFAGDACVEGVREEGEGDLSAWASDICDHCGKEASLGGSGSEVSAKSGSSTCDAFADAGAEVGCAGAAGAAARSAWRRITFSNSSARSRKAGRSASATLRQDKSTVWASLGYFSCSGNSAAASKASSGFSAMALSLVATSVLLGQFTQGIWPSENSSQSSVPVDHTSPRWLNFW